MRDTHRQTCTYTQTRTQPAWRFHKLTFFPLRRWSRLSENRVCAGKWKDNTKRMALPKISRNVLFRIEKSENRPYDLYVGCWIGTSTRYCERIPHCFFYRCLHPVAYIAVINLCYRLRTLFLFIVLFSTLHFSTSAGHPQVFHIYHTTPVLRAHSLLLVPSRH
jgi:hypothetical protein